MNKEQQIKEMAEAIRYTNVKLDVFDYLSTNNLKFEAIADGLYNAGYRKQSDVAKEFVYRLERKAYNELLQGALSLNAEQIMSLVDKVAKEFGVEE